MIRVGKSSQVPASLLVENCRSYNGQDVQATLLSDQRRKCYLCEQKTTKSFEIEHLKAQADYPELKFIWSNLFLACGYCNSHKTNNFEILKPDENDIEDIISHRLNLLNKSADFSSLRIGVQEEHTVRLLDKLFNGKNKSTEPKVKVGHLYDDLVIEMEFFMSLLVDHENNKQKIIDSLSFTKEFLAFKYWIIKDNNSLYNEFKGYMTWNKVVS